MCVCVGGCAYLCMQVCVCVFLVYVVYVCGVCLCKKNESFLVCVYACI